MCKGVGCGDDGVGGAWAMSFCGEVVAYVRALRIWQHVIERT